VRPRRRHSERAARDRRTGGIAPRQGGKFVRLHAAESIPTRALEIDGVHGLESERGAGSSAGSSDGTEYAFTFTGDINTLLGDFVNTDCSIARSRKRPSRRFSCGFYGDEETDAGSAAGDRVPAGTGAADDGVGG